MRCFAKTKKKGLHESCRMGRRIVVMKLICSLRLYEGDGHTVHKLSQRRLTADRLVPRESDCSRMGSKVFSNRLPSYIKATRPALEIFKMAAYFPDSPRINKRKPTVRNAVQAPHLSNRNDGVRHATSLNYSSSSPIQTPSKHIF